MLDPLSVSLAVIAIATALKDSIETMQIIRDSCSKRPQNYRNAERLATEVLSILDGMKKICIQHEAILDKEEPLKRAITDLQIEMKSVLQECIRLIPPVVEGYSKIGRIRLAVYSFWNRKQVERLLAELKGHVHACSDRFQLLNGMRTEARVDEIQDTILQFTTQSSVIIHGHSNFSNANMLYSGLGNITNTQLYAFTRSTPMPMTRITDTVTEYDLSKAYLRLQIGKINVSLRSILARWSQNPPADVEIPIFATTYYLEEPLVPSIVVHQDAIILAIRIQSLPRYSQIISWIRNVNAMMDKLWRKLDELNMYEDAIAIGTLSADIWREITRQYPSPDSFRYLVHALKRSGESLFQAGDTHHARLKIEEAINILWSLAAPEPVTHLESKEDIRQNIFLQILNYWVSADKSPQLVLDARRMFRVKGAFELDDLRPGMDNWPILSSSLAVELRNQEISDDDWYTMCVHNLRCIGDIRDPAYWSPSHDMNKLALMILNHLLAKYPDSHYVQVGLEITLDRLSSRSVDRTDSAAVMESLEFRNQHSAVLRRLSLIIPQCYVLRLADSLWRQRETLLALGRLTEAEDAYQDMINLKDLAAAPLHSNLRIPSETEGDYYAGLSECHYDAEQFADAVYAAQNAISQYSALEYMDPGQSRKKHIKTLVLLCKYLYNAHQYDAALTEGEKAIKMIEDSNLHGSDSDLMNLYAETLRQMMGTLMESSHSRPTRALVQAEDINIRIQKLARFGKVQFRRDLAHGLITYAKVLQKHALNTEASKYLQHLLDNWEEMYDLSDVSTTMLYIGCFEQFKAILEGQGRIDLALHYSNQARMFIRKTSKDVSNCYDTLFSLYFRRLDLDHISLLLDAGHCLEALEFSEAMVSDTRKDSSIVAVLAAVLSSQALVQLYNGLPEDAIATTTEALSLWQTIPLKGDSHAGYLIDYEQYSSLVALTRGLHDIGKVEEALSRLDEAETAAQKWKSVTSMEELKAVTAGDGSEYETLLFERSKLLFTKGDYLEAVKLIEKIEVVQKNYSEENDLSALESSANTLSYSCVLHCTLGRHDKGLAAAIEFTKLKESIRESSPARARLFDVRLDRMTRRGAWKSVQDAKERLTCTHQNDF